MHPSSGGRVAAVVLAGGSGTRFGASVSKVYVPLAGRPVLAHALALVDACDDVDDVVVVIRAEDRAAYDEVAAHAPTRKVRAVVPGGETRQGSEWAGLKAVVAHAPDAELVLLHDAARPLATTDLVHRLLTTARAAGGAIPGVQPDADLLDDAGAIVPTDDLVAVQTPQAFRLVDLLDTYGLALAAGFDGVDTAETVQAFRPLAIQVVPSTPDNLKVTVPEDLAAAEALLATRARPDGLACRPWSPPAPT